MPDAPLKIKFNTPFQQAVEAANQRGVMLPADYYALPAAMRSRQFTVSYLAKLDQVQAIFTSLQKAQVSGISLQQWQKEIDYQQFGITKAHTETVFRNAMQTHYAIGHWESFQRTKKALPYLRYSAINDSRTSACCRALSGIIRRVDDPFWATHTPPNHHNCRSTLQALTESQAQKRSPAGVGLNQVESTDMNPQKGWDYNPAASHDVMLKDLVKQKIENLPVKGQSFTEKLLSIFKKVATEASIIPVSKSLMLPLMGSIKKTAQFVLQEIDSIHGDGVLPKIPLQKVNNSKVNGSYRHSNGVSKSIKLDADSSHPELTLLHEIGHFIDHQAIGKMGVFASLESDFLDDWRRAIDASEATKNLANAKISEKRQQYYLSRKEQWARSYAQYIATKSNQPRLKIQLGKILNHSLEFYRYSQWRDDDFIVIMAEIDALFEKLGWIKNDK